ncbi:pre-mRNA-splicing factor SLU7-like [Epinephelus fuscoguttatus]|uniref:pre-mRNA-splicing factor SLU7-like n=1 Tax=Epinephelus fuscoguttatus TaxID=293821 RepID=UPI0020D0A886|nr:pre-mRNA-splicing factor SLU7-like [Epinephelus fuscoguttatus]
MARHLTRKHSDEKEVALATNLPPSSKKRRHMLEGLRRKGNYYHNIGVLQKGQVPPSSEVGAVQESQVSGNDLEIFNERSFEDSDEEVNILTQKSVTRRPLDEKKRTEKTGKRPKRVSEPAEDSDEEIDVLTQNTVTGRPSDEMKKSEKRGKRRKRVSEPVEDSDEEIDVLTQNTVTGRPSDKMKKSEKRGKRRKRVSEPVEDSDEEIDVLTQNTVTGRPSDEMKKSEKTGKLHAPMDILHQNRPSASHKNKWN